MCSAKLRRRRLHVAPACGIISAAAAPRFRTGQRTTGVAASCWCVFEQSDCVNLVLVPADCMADRHYVYDTLR